MIQISGISKTYKTKGDDFHALDNVSFSVETGEMVSVIGSSGSGKSTLLHILGCLDTPTCGSYRLMGMETTTMPRNCLDLLRRDTIGFVFQGFFLLPLSTTLENVTLPLFYRGVQKDERMEKGLKILSLLGLSDKADSKPSALSGGQQQRVAIGRALVTDPPLLLADEPTGNLDPYNRDQALSLLKDQWSRGKTVVLITHDPVVASSSPRIISIEDGHLSASTNDNKNS